MKEISEETNKRIRVVITYLTISMFRMHIITAAPLFSFIILNESNLDDDNVVLMFLHYSKHKRLMQ